MAAVIDIQVISSLRTLQRPGKPCVLNRLVLLFEGDAPQQVQKIESALHQQDTELAGRLAHGLKSSAANLGAMALSRQCLHLETAARSNDLPACRGHAHGLADALDDVLASLFDYCREAR